MSVEIFFGQFDPREPRRGRVIIESRQALTYRAEPRVVTFAQMMVDAGRERLAEITQRHSRGNSVELNEELLKEIVRGRGGIELGAIVLGVSVMSLHETLVEGQYNPAVFNSRFVKATSGTAVTVYAEPEDLVPEPVEPPKWKGMAVEARRDPTFAGFFEQEGLLPEKLQGTLSGSGGIYLELLRMPLPRYEEIARTLITDSPQIPR